MLQSIRFQDLSETQEAVLKAASLPIVIIGAFIAAPILMYMDDGTPVGPPAENCCFVWLEKLPSGDVITGQAPE